MMGKIFIDWIEDCQQTSLQISEIPAQLTAMKARLENHFTETFADLSRGDVAVLLPHPNHEYHDEIITCAEIEGGFAAVAIGTTDLWFRIASFPEYPVRILKAGEKIVLGK